MPGSSISHLKWMRVRRARRKARRCAVTTLLITARYSMMDDQNILALPSGYRLGKYAFKGVLGSGGFGITYLADDTSLERKVAIKEMLPNDFATRLDGTTVVAKTRTDKTNLDWAPRVLWMRAER